MLNRAALLVLLAVVGLQFYRPEKNISSQPPGPEDFLVKHAAPPEVRRLFSVACYDCHSNNTRYPWYAEIQPTGWWLTKHVDEGRDGLDLSSLGAAPAKKQAKRIDAMVDVITDRSMPLPSYTWIHRDAILDATQIKLLNDWLGQVREKLGVDE
jgi:hypothetical protein